MIDVIPVPEHNNTGEPGGPFNSFDISWIAPPASGTGHNFDFVSDRIGLAVDVIDTNTNLAVNALQGSNAVTDAGNASRVPATPPFLPSSRCTAIAPGSGAGRRTVYPICVSGFGANGNFGGFPGAQCCASRGNGVNPMSGPDGEISIARRQHSV